MESKMDQDVQPKEAKNVDELLELLNAEKKRIRYTLYQPHLLMEMKTNVIKISDTLKHSIDKGAMITHQNIEGINELCPEISKYISILTVSVKIINYSLCECAANQLIKVTINLFDSIYKLFLYIKMHSNNKNNKDNDNNHDEQKNDNPNQKNLTTLVGIVWERLKLLKIVPLDNITSIGREILKTLTVVRDAKKEIKESIKDMENNECIIKIEPWKYDYSKLDIKQINTNNQNDDNKNDDDNDNHDNDNILNDYDDDDDDDDFLLIGMEEEELTELESLRVYQIYECIMFVDEVINHIYLFIIKHFKENINDLDGQKKWLTNLTETIGLLPKYVDELSCCIYTPQPPDNQICKNASNLLHFLWKIAIDVAEESQQYKNRKMVIKNKKKKKGISLTGHEWKCKFIDYNIKIGKMFGLLSMDHINKYIQNDSKYNKQKNKKQQKKQKKKQKRKKGKMNKFKKQKSINNEVSASSQKEQESNNNQTENTPQPNNKINEIISNEQENNDQGNNEDIVDID